MNQLTFEDEGRTFTCEAAASMATLDTARAYCDRIIGMSQGEIVFDGPPQALQDAHLLQIYGGEGWLQ